MIYYVIELVYNHILIQMIRQSHFIQLNISEKIIINFTKCFNNYRLLLKPALTFLFGYINIIKYIFKVDIDTMEIFVKVDVHCKLFVFLYLCVYLCVCWTCQSLILSWINRNLRLTCFFVNNLNVSFCENKTI